MDKFIKEIKSFFNDNNLDLEKSKQHLPRSKKTEVLRLTKMARTYEKIIQKHGHISCKCQSRINDFLILLQIFVKENSKDLSKKLKSELLILAKEKGIEVDENLTKKEIIELLNK